MNSPQEITRLATEAGARKAGLAQAGLGKLLFLAGLAGAFIALGGMLSIAFGYSWPGLAEVAPGWCKVLMGIAFPIGLILVVVLGAELFTGNNAMLIPAFMSRRATVGQVVWNWTVVYVGNFLGAIAFVFLLVYWCGLLDNPAYGKALSGIATAKVSMPWIMVMLKGIGANWLVCLALWLAMAGTSLLEKAFGCWLPVMAFVALGFEHSIANMFFLPAGMLSGADITVGQAIWDNLIPATIGNIIGGALLVGTLHSRLYPAKA